MALSAQMTALRLFRIALFVKVITILASLLVALALGERAAQQHLSLAMFLTTLLLVLFGTNWLEARLGAAYFPLALLLAIPPQALEWGLRPLVPGQNLLTDFGAVEPFLFLVLLVVLAAGRYGFGAALLATVAAAIAHSLAVLWFDGLAHVDLISLAARLFILGAAAMTTAWLRLSQPAATDTHSPEPALPVPVTDKLSADDLRRRLARVLLELDAASKASKTGSLTTGRRWDTRWPSPALTSRTHGRWLTWPIRPARVAWGLKKRYAIMSRHSVNARAPTWLCNSAWRRTAWGRSRPQPPFTSWKKASTAWHPGRTRRPASP